MGASACSSRTFELDTMAVVLVVAATDDGWSVVVVVPVVVVVVPAADDLAWCVAVATNHAKENDLAVDAWCCRPRPNRELIIRRSRFR